MGNWCRNLSSRAARSPTSSATRWGLKRLHHHLLDEGGRFRDHVELRVEHPADRLHGADGLEHQENIRRKPQSKPGGDLQQVVQELADFDVLERAVKMPAHEIRKLALQLPQIRLLLPAGQLQQHLGGPGFVAAHDAVHQLDEHLPRLAVHHPHHAEIHAGR